MITIEIGQREGSFRAKVSGHAKYAEPGKDIVCAAVSTLTNALANTVLALKSEGLVEEAYFLPQERPTFVAVRYGRDQTIRTVMGIYAVMFRQLAEQYPKNVRVRME